MQDMQFIQVLVISLGRSLEEEKESKSSFLKLPLSGVSWMLLMDMLLRRCRFHTSKQK